MSGLSPSTTYHYQIQVVGEGGTTATADATFTTAEPGATTTVTTTLTNTVTQNVTTTLTNTLVKMVEDTTPPSLKLVQLKKKVYETAPIISGSALDDRGIARVEYRIKGREKSWSQASMDAVGGAKKVSFELLPPLTLDGTYIVEVRAVDLFGNTSIVKEVKFVIDLLPPTVGGGVISYGALPMEARDGKVELLASFPYEVLVYENGGAEKVTIEVGENLFELQKESEGLWRGRIVMAAGEYQTKVVARDGAGNETKREWAKLTVKPLGIMDVENLRVFWLDPTTKRFAPWEGEEYGMPSIGRVLPKGEYYLSAIKDGVKVVSQKLTLGATTNIDNAWNFGPMSWWDRVKSKFGWRKQVEIAVPSFANPPSQNASEGRGATEGQNSRRLIVGREFWIGKKSVVYIGTPNLPWYSETLSRATEWAEKENAQLIVLDEQGEDDPKGEWLEKLNVGLLPQVYLIDNKGDTVDYKEGIWER